MIMFHPPFFQVSASMSFLKFMDNKKPFSIFVVDE